MERLLGRNKPEFRGHGFSATLHFQISIGIGSTGSLHAPWHLNSNQPPTHKFILSKVEDRIQVVFWFILVLSQ